MKRVDLSMPNLNIRPSARLLSPSFSLDNFVNQTPHNASLKDKSSSFIQTNCGKGENNFELKKRHNLNSAGV